MAIQLSKRWQDMVILVLGLWLFVSPWAMGMPSDSTQAINAYVAGAVIAILAVFDLYKTYLWAVLVNLAVGLWSAVSPWVLRFDAHEQAVVNFAVVGIAVVMLALWELRSDPDLQRQWSAIGHAG